MPHLRRKRSTLTFHRWKNACLQGAEFHIDESLDFDADACTEAHRRNLKGCGRCTTPQVLSRIPIPMILAFLSPVPLGSIQWGNVTDCCKDPGAAVVHYSYVQERAWANPSLARAVGRAETWIRLPTLETPFRRCISNGLGRSLTSFTKS
jgi:hypothetical protein